jgi:hypothetical protein
MKATMKKTSSFGKALLGFAATSLVTVVACSDDETTPSSGPTGTNASAACQQAPKVEKDSFCESCQMSPTAQPSSCKAPRTVNACCAWVTPPSRTLERSVGLHRYSGTDPTIQLSCLDEPGAVGTPSTVTLKGFVRLFSSGSDSAGVKIEIFKENDNGSLGEAVGTPVITSGDDDVNVKKEDWLEKCPEGGCTFRGYTYPGVPTETRLIIKTSDASGSSQWAALYDYNNFFPTAAASGEVHDCGDIRLAGATVDIDTAHEGDMFYFGENEADPLPDKTRSSAGTSRIGLFGTLNVTTGVPIRISAIGNYNGQTVLLGTHTVQTFKGSVTALRLRGRRPWQK